MDNNNNETKCEQYSIELRLKSSWVDHLFKSTIICILDSSSLGHKPWIHQLDYESNRICLILDSCSFHSINICYISIVGWNSLCFIFTHWNIESRIANWRCKWRWLLSSITSTFNRNNTEKNRTIVDKTDQLFECFLC